MTTEAPLIYSIGSIGGELANTIELFLSSGRITCEIRGEGWGGFSAMKGSAQRAREILRANFPAVAAEVRILECPETATPLHFRLMRMAAPAHTGSTLAPPVREGTAPQLLAAEWMYHHYRGAVPIAQRLALVINRQSYLSMRELGLFSDTFTAEANAVLEAQLAAAAARKSAATPKTVWDVALALIEAGDPVPTATIVALVRVEGIIPEPAKSRLRAAGYL